MKNISFYNFLFFIALMLQTAKCKMTVETQSGREKQLFPPDLSNLRIFFFPIRFLQFYIQRHIFCDDASNLLSNLPF